MTGQGFPPVGHSNEKLSFRGVHAPILRGAVIERGHSVRNGLRNYERA